MSNKKWAIFQKNILDDQNFNLFSNQLVYNKKNYKFVSIFYEKDKEREIFASVYVVFCLVAHKNTFKYSVGVGNCSSKLRNLHAHLLRSAGNATLS